MKWSSIKTVYGGLIGNAIFFISIISIVTIVPLEQFANIGLSVSIVGAIILSIAYVLTKIFTPSMITEFSSHLDYYRHLVLMKENGSFSLIHEFSVLDDKPSVGELPVFSSPEFTLHPLTSISEYKKILGESKALYSLSIIKYSYSETLYKKTRYLLTSSFLVGVAFLYYPPAKRVYETILSGV